MILKRGVSAETSISSLASAVSIFPDFKNKFPRIDPKPILINSRELILVSYFLHISEDQKEGHTLVQTTKTPKYKSQ
jgi:hypothetical protein